MRIAVLRRLWPAVMAVPLVAWLLLPDAGPTALWPGGEVIALGGSDAVMVVYVGADDCAPCRTFYRERWPAIRDSPSLAGVDFREVRSARFRDVLADEYWTADLRPHRDALPHDAGVPLWVVVRNGDAVKTVWGVTQWDEQVMPLLNQIAVQ